ncbi:MAG TPA: L-threonylcarbamoyladenylate synthase [Streptosporangiaceae bacterium]
MSERYDCSDPEQRAAGLKAAVEAVRRGELIVLPTDTVYGIGADAFSPAAVAGLLAAKRRGRDMPPPVLVGTVSAATALIEDMDNIGRRMIEEFWPGGLTLVCRVSRSLTWDLGDTEGTVAVRMPLHSFALDLLKETGPLAVSSANVSGQPAATTADEAEQQLGDEVAVILDGGPATGGVASTIVDVTGVMPRLLRAGAIGVEKLAAVALVASENTDPPGTGDAGTDPGDTDPSDTDPSGTDASDTDPSGMDAAGHDPADELLTERADPVPPEDPEPPPARPGDRAGTAPDPTPADPAGG